MIIPFGFMKTRGGVSFDSDAQAFITAVGTLNSTEQNAINDLVLGLKANGTWNKYIAIYPVVGSTASEHKWNLKDPRDLDAAYRLVFNGTITHASTGFTGGGANTDYADTFFNTSLLASTVDCALGFYSRCQVDTGLEVEIGGRGFSGSEFKLSFDNSDLYYCRVGTNEITSSAKGAVTDNFGYLFVSKRSATDMELYLDGVSIGTNTTSNTPPTSTNNVWILGNNQGLTTSYFPSTKECAFAAISNSLTSTEIANDYTVIQQYQTDLSREL